jgi:hypothetical protein
MIPISKLTYQPIRTVSAKIFYFENGEKITTTVAVNYFPMTVAAENQRQKASKESFVPDKDGNVGYVDVLAARVESIPEFVDEKNDPVICDKAFFSSLHIENVNSIFQAVNSDMNPKSIILPSPNGSKAKVEKEASAT